MRWPSLLPAFRFPRPSGPYAIGTRTFHWVDQARAELFSPDPRARRELLAQIWYPGQSVPGARPAPYMPDADAFVAAFARLHRKPAFVLRGVERVATNAVAGAPVAGDQASYPALIFLAGTTGFRQMNTFQAEELASHGYVVVGLDQPYVAASVVFPDRRQVTIRSIEQLQPLIRASYLPADPAPLLGGRPVPEGSVVPFLARDVSFALDQLAALDQADQALAGRLGLARAGVFGVSLGGIVAAEACLREPRLRACLMLDAPMPLDVVRVGLRQPCMWITRDAEVMRLERARAGGWPEIEIEAHLRSMRAVYQRLPGDGYFVQVPGMFHSNFTDIPAWLPSMRWLGLAGPIEVRRAHAIVNAYALAFFDRQLRGGPAERFDQLKAGFPEVRCEARRP